MVKKLLSGNEAVAYGAYLAGARLGSAYPGTPSTEIMEEFSKYPGVYAEWSPNEKVAMDVAVGASYAGKRAFASMKHVGVNVAADSLFYASYTGSRAGLVLVSADDPGMHSSQNEQDSRNYAKFAKVPMLDPADSEEAKLFMVRAFEISEQFDTPVVVRTTTRISHSRTLVDIADLDSTSEELEDAEPTQFEIEPSKYVMVPANARLRHVIVEEKLKKLTEFAAETELNRVEPGNSELGIITGGVSYQYAKEIFPRATFLKLGMAYPLSKKLFNSFAERVEKILVVEELDPFYEEYARQIGLKVLGKEVFPLTGEFSPTLIRECGYKSGVLKEETLNLTAVTSGSNEAKEPLPLRPPMLCPGCGHRGIFYALQKLRAVVLGDIGCYTLGAAPPLNAMHTVGCMGASIGVVHGVDKARVKNRTAAVLGDSTFFHAGIAPLMNIVYNRGVSTTIIVDNRITAMTGHQANPGTGSTLQGDSAPVIDLEKLCRGLGIEKVETVNPFELSNVLKVLKEHMDSPEPSVIIARYPCVLNIKERKPALVVDSDLCSDCGTCLRIGCPSLLKEEGHVSIDPLLCNGCGYCVQVCPRNAISSKNNN